MSRGPQICEVRKVQQKLTDVAELQCAPTIKQVTTKDNLKERTLSSYRRKISASSIPPSEKKDEVSMLFNISHRDQGSTLS